MIILKSENINIITGHFGSGKTEFAINLALRLKEKNQKVTIIDFDIVNPYYRTKDAREMLEEQGIKVIASEFANTNLEIPSVPAEINSVFEQEGIIIFDVGGDEDGAIALGRYFDKFQKKGYNMYCVLNERRMQTSNAEDCETMIHEIESASRLSVNGIINNTHLGGFTTIDDIIRGQSLAEKVAENLEIEVEYICGTEENLAQLPSKYDNIKFPIKLYIGERV